MEKIEILDNLDVLTKPSIDLTLLSLDGVQFGSHVSVFPRHKIITLTLAKIVALNAGGQDYDSTGRLLTRNEVIDSVFCDGGIAHLESELSYKIANGHVVGFAIYGDQLKHFNYIKTYEQCVQCFGKPDLVRKDEAYGDLMGYYNYYYKSQKCVHWDSLINRIYMINIGNYKGNNAVVT